MWRILIILAFVASSCDATRVPCRADSDCFVGERCADTVCVAIAEPDMSSPDLADMGTAGNCLVDPDACGKYACNTSSGECFRCEFDRQCGPNAACDVATGECGCFTGYHRCGYQCAADDDATQCGDSCERCPDDLFGAPVCANDMCGIACDPGFLPCEGINCLDDSVCTECLTDNDCGPQAPLCNDGRCGECSESNECVRFDDEKVCHDGECVECTPSARDVCGAFSCDPKNFVCTETLILSKETCEACVADEECNDSEDRCVWMEFGGAKRPQSYCMSKREAVGCRPPYPVSVIRESESGVPSDTYCTINETKTTCEAFKDYTTNCRLDEDCGVEGLADGLCKLFPDRDRCTYPCESVTECLGGTVCATYCVPFD